MKEHRKRRCSIYRERWKYESGEWCIHKTFRVNSESIEKDGITGSCRKYMVARKTRTGYGFGDTAVLYAEG